ncbi:hypothetical protein BaRGS_00013153, partial [Batillaria attramentaria]
FFRPLKTHFLQAQETWLRNNPGRKISAFQIAHLVNSAYSKAASISNAWHSSPLPFERPVQPMFFSTTVNIQAGEFIRR